MDLSDLHLPDFDAEPKIITATIEGILEEDDLRELLMPEGSVPAETTAKGVVVSAPAPKFIPVEEDPHDLKRLREKHHSVARLISKGMPQGLVASITGYTPAYLSVLLNAPAMRELVEMYRATSGAASEVITERLKTVGAKAIDKLEDKLEADQLDAFQLIGVAKLGLDRGGHGPTSKHHVVSETHIVDHAELQKRNQEALARSAEVIIPMSEVRKALPSPDAAEEGVADAGA